MLTAGAVIGRSFQLELLQAVVDVSEDEVLDAVEEAERAQLVAIRPDRRSVRYGFVHELIRTTLVDGLSLPRRQRLHLRIADALESRRSGQSAQARNASALAHHLYQAGAAADEQRTAGALLAAGRAAIASGAFEETLEAFDNLISLELPETDPSTPEAMEQRGVALAALQRQDEAVASFERALDLYHDRGDDPGIARVAGAMSGVLAWQARFDESREAQASGLRMLSADARAERARLLMLSWFNLSPGGIDDAWQHMNEARAIAETLDDADLHAEALARTSLCLRIMSEYGASLEIGRQALALVPDDGRWTRPELLASLVQSSYYLGRVTECQAWLSQLEACAARTGQRGALWIHERVRSGIALHRSGDLRAYLTASEDALRGRHFRFINRGMAAVPRLYADRRSGITGRERALRGTVSAHVDGH